MIWGKRRFEDADYGPYMDKLEMLLLADASHAAEYSMVSVEAEQGQDYYVGVPGEGQMKHFDGFARVADADLPEIIDTIHVDAGAAQRLFRIRHRNP